MTNRVSLLARASGRALLAAVAAGALILTGPAAGAFAVQPDLGTEQPAEAAPSWTVSGVITDTDGHALGADPTQKTATTVLALPAGEDPGSVAPTQQSNPDSEGGYSLTLPVGDYDLYVAHTRFGAVFAAQKQQVSVVDANITQNVTVDLKTHLATGRVLDATGNPVAGVRVSSYLWQAGAQAAEGDTSVIPVPGDSGDSGLWGPGFTAVTGADGGFAVPVPLAGGKVLGASISDTTFALKLRKNGFLTYWYGPAAVQSAAPQLPGSTWFSTANVALADLSMVTTPSGIGTVAGQKLDFCSANAVQANDDDSSPAVTLPFGLRFYNQDYTQAYINNNGNISFGKPVSQFTPGDLTSTTQPAPMIAPFFADVDTRNDASWEVTYGASADNKTFCVNWDTVGYFNNKADKTNVFQLLITKPDDAARQQAGDADITFNYDRIGWETGAASKTKDADISAGVGYTAGTGESGTFFELLGSRVPGSFVDGGPRALIGNQLNSGQVGRYRFEVRNDQSALLGEIKGTLTAAADSKPQAGAMVQACPSSGADCQIANSASDGTFSFPALRAGDYKVIVSPPAGLAGAVRSATVNGGRSTDLGLIGLSAPTPLPSGATITQVGANADNVPVVAAAKPLALSVPNPCADGTTAAGTWAVIDNAEATLASGELTTNGATLTATVPALGSHGAGRVETAVTCDAAPSSSLAFDIYIDPSGTVYDRFGLPAAGAKVELQRSDTQLGTFATLANGSTLMDPSNRLGTTTLGATGQFQWNVVDGWYQVKVSKSGCTTQTTAPMEVPPARLELGIKLDCGAAPNPTTALTATGTASSGSTLTARSATFAVGSPVVAAGYAWKWENGAVRSTAGSYKIVDADLGHTLSLVQTWRAPAVASNIGTSQLAFDAFGLTKSWTLPLKKFAKAPTPKISGTAKAGKTLKVALGAWSPKPERVTYQWLRNGKVIAKATKSSYKLTKADRKAKISVRVIGSKTGYAPLTRTSAAKKVAR